MDFTREPVIETIITPKEGSKLVLRTNQGNNQEEYFVDSVEVVCFGRAFFFRSVEKPKPFLLPVSDYEVLEVREARMVLKHVGADKSIKIGKPKVQPKKETKPQQPQAAEKPPEEANEEEPKKENKPEKKRERRRHTRRRRGKEDEAGQQSAAEQEEYKVPLPEPGSGNNVDTKTFFSSLLPPPPTLISETIAKYRSELEGEQEKNKLQDKVPEKKNEQAEAPKNETAISKMPEKEQPQAEVSKEEPVHAAAEPKEDKKRSFWDFTKELTGGGTHEES